MIITPRTILRPMTMDDAAVLFSWRSDPKVMRFAAYGPDPDLATTKRKIETAMECDVRFGFSRWLVLDRVTGEPIGDAGLLPMPDGDGFELGYRLRRDQWGRGLATEIASGWVAHTRDHLGLPFLVAFTHHDHIASQRVLDKAGFRRSGERVVYGMPSLFYRLDLSSRES